MAWFGAMTILTVGATNFSGMMAQWRFLGTSELLSVAKLTAI